MDGAMEMTKRFFALPSAEKEEFKIRELGGVGYGRFFEYPGGSKDWVDRLVLCPVNKDVREPYDLAVTNLPGFQYAPPISTTNFGFELLGSGNQ